jgi:hypothetical protein
MATASKPLARDPVFARFLAAPVGEDGKGASVTVLSMLARLDVDPWEEAEDLTKMPEATARQRLEALLERFKDVPTRVSDRSRLALGLLSFLPRKTGLTAHSASTNASSPASNPASKQTSKQAGKQTSVTTKPGLALPVKGAPIYWIIATALILGWIVKLAQGG